MVYRSASSDSNDDLSPLLRPVLSSLNISLEAELNRYRRNRLTKDAASDDVFADLNDATFDLNVAEIADINVSASTVSLLPPPPVPPNRRLNLEANKSEDKAGSQTSDTSSRSLVRYSDSMLENSDSTSPNSTNPNSANPNSASLVSTSSDGNSASAASPTEMLPDAVLPGSIVNVTAVRADSSESPTPSGYLKSSEKLIESLDDLPPMPEPVDIAPKPRRKTVSLLAGAILGLLGLFAGLGVSYLVSSPSAMQKLAALFERKDEAVIAEAESTFDPPGPDLSEREFINLELDNLSSLEMSSEPLNPAEANTGTQAGDRATSGPSPDRLPPIEEQSSGQSSTSLSNTEGIQAAVVPTGVTYYVTVPFTTAQDLANVRQTVEEAFVRSFSDGSRIQIAAFDNPTDAQAFVNDVKSQGITAFVYGPTTE